MTAVGGAGPRIRSGTAAGERTAGSLGAALVRALDGEQERWFLWLPVLFGAGVAVYFALPREPTVLAALLPLVAAIAIRSAAAQGPGRALFGVALVTAACGVTATKLRTEAMRAPVLQRELGPVTMRGYVELVEPRPGKAQRITLRVSALERLPREAWPYRVRVRTGAQNPEVRPGDLVTLQATLGPPPGPSLPGDYDFARGAWFQALGAVGFARERAQLVTDAGEPAPVLLRIMAAVARVRQAIGTRILEALPGETGAIADALITGERGGISEATNQAFRDAGLFHILSISGLHMVVMAGAVFYCVRLLLAAIPAVALDYPIKKWAAAAAMLGALAYLLISGASFPTVRSYIMISIMFLAVMLDRPALALRNVALAALAILLLWPESLLDAGFQMSFAAVVALVSAYEWLHARQAQRDPPQQRGPLRRGVLFFWEIVVSTLVASLAVAPFGLYHFHNTQFFAIAANLIAIPICNLVVMPAALATLLAMPFGLEALPLRVMGWGIEAMVWCAERVAALPGSVGRVPAIPSQAFLLMVAGGLWLTLWRTRWRVLGLVPIALGCLLAPWAARPDVLVGRNAQAVAVRGDDGRLSALAGRGSTFELTRWLEHDGDGRTAAEAARGSAFRCDGLGCTARVKGRVVAVTDTPATLRDDCAAADILILRFDRPKACAPHALSIDAQAVARQGAHALSVGADGGIRVETVADWRGDRPWAPGPR
jgi:competence protein ComEC